jgi:hypothetical protein
MGSKPKPTERNKPMDDKFLESLTDGEKEQFAADLEASAQKIKEAREALRLAEIHKAYLAEMTQISQTTRGDWKLRAIADLKAKYRARGLQVV